MPGYKACPAVGISTCPAATARGGAVMRGRLRGCRAVRSRAAGRVPSSVRADGDGGRTPHHILPGPVALAIAWRTQAWPVGSHDRWRDAGAVERGGLEIRLECRKFRDHGA